MIDSNVSTRSAAGLHFYFVSLNLKYPESNHPIHERYAEILKWFPEMSKRTFADDLSDIFEKALKECSGRSLVAAYDLTILQSRFYTLAYENHMVTFPVREIHREQSLQWQLKFHERLPETSQTRRAGDRIRKGHTRVETKVPYWLH